MATILVADDNSNIQKMVGLALKDHGIEVVAVGNGEAAVRRIPDLHPDLVLADIFMPVKNGYEVCEFVKKNAQFSHIPVILLVGAFDPLDEREAQRVGADGVLKKPFIPPDPLISMVKSALARSAGSKHIPIPTVPVSVPQPVLAAVPHSDHVIAVEQPMPAKPAAVSFGETNRPVAFGSLLETEEMESGTEQAYVAPVPHPELSDSRNWGVTPVEEEVEEEETEPSWRAASVPDELLTADGEQTSVRSQYADTILTEKEDIGISAGTVSAEPVDKGIQFAETAAATSDTGTFAAGQNSAEDATQNETAKIGASTDPGLTIGGETQIQQEAHSSQVAKSEDATITEQETSAQQTEPAQKSDYETVFTPDAFPGLFVEEKPPTSLELSSESLQDSPSAFFELPGRINEPEAGHTESHSAEPHVSENEPIETETAQTGPQQTATPPKLPTLWEEQVRQAARLIASTWPNEHQPASASNQQRPSFHSEPFASESWPAQPSSAPQEYVHPKWEAQNHDAPSEASPTLESTPADNSWLTQQGQQLISSEVVSPTDSALDETQSVPRPGEPESYVRNEVTAQESAHQPAPVSDSVSEHRDESAHDHSARTPGSGETGPASLYLADYYANRSPQTQNAEPVVSSTESPVTADAFAHADTAVQLDSDLSGLGSTGVAEKAVDEPDAKERLQEAATPSATSPTPPSTTPPDFEAVVAQVLARMNPEMFQSMTQQLLKPVIEALVRSELEKKQ